MRFYSKNELKDSRIFFDQNPPRFAMMFSLGVAVILIVTFIVSTVYVKTSIVKAQGVVNTTDNQYVSVNVNGTVVEILANEGDFVEAGTPLIKITNGQESLQIDSLQMQLTQAHEKLEIMDLYQKSLLEKKNHMKNEGLQQEYYGYVEYYLSQVTSEDYTNNATTISLNEKISKKEILTQNINDLKREMLEMMIPTVDEQETIRIQEEIEIKEQEIHALQEKLESSSDLNVIEKYKQEVGALEEQIKVLDKALEEAQKQVKNVEQLESRQAEIQSQMDTAESELGSLNEEIKSLQEQLDSPNSQASQMHAQLIMELGKSRTSIQTQVTELEANIKMYGGQVETYTINASNAGIVHYLSTFRVGVSVQQNQVIAEISTQEASNFIVEAFVNATDIAKISIGDTVNIAVLGVNTTKYGTIQGSVVTIDSGTISQESDAGSVLLYRIEVAMNQYQLTSNSDTVQLIKSMPVEARIVYEEETYLEWILELLSFRN